MNKYNIFDTEIDSVDLVCLVISNGAKVAKEVYKKFTKINHLGINPLMCNCNVHMILLL